MSNCCVDNCNNNARKCPEIHFYSFPVARHKMEQREKWIAAVKKKNPDGSIWQPNKSTRICSRHFVGNSKSESMLSPSYVPSIFPMSYNMKKMNEESAINRHKRFMKRRFGPDPTAEPLFNFVKTEVKLEEFDILPSCTDQSTQVDFLYDDKENSMTFLSNRFVHDGICDVECQTEIKIDKRRVILNSIRKTRDKCCGNEKYYKDASVSTDYDPFNQDISSSFFGIHSVKNNEICLELYGVSFAIYTKLLKLLPNSEKSKLPKENRLLIFLCKMKTGLSYRTLGVLFGTHRTTVSRIFVSVLLHLTAACKEFVAWPKKEDVMSTMPKIFKKTYKNARCRAIIDFAEISVESPTIIENFDDVSSNEKKGTTLKILVASNPCGNVSFVSKCFDGRTSDSEVTTSSGLFDLLETDDLLLADKAYVGVKRAIEESEKNISIARLNLREDSRLSRDTDDDSDRGTSNGHKIRYRRGMQKIKIFRILCKYPSNLLQHSNDIVFMCCVLANLKTIVQPSQNITVANENIN